jgi:hypothetical protein
MKHDSLTQSSNSKTSAIPRHAASIWMLMVLSPIIAEVLTGSTRLSFIFVLIPEVMVWGVGALLCRELVRRWRGAGPSLLLMGLALSVAEEFLIQQTSLAPLPFIGASAVYERAWGVNWLYFLFMLGFESVWVVLVPVQVTELIFPERRRQPWLQRKGLIFSCITFSVGSYVAWYSWTQQAMPKTFHVPAYHPPHATIGLGLLAVVLLISAAYLLRGFGHASQDDAETPVSPWLVSLAAFVMGAAWFELIRMVFSPKPKYSIWESMTTGCVWALLAFALLLHWSTRRKWRDTQRWSACFGAIVGAMSATSLTLAGWSKPDLIFKITVDVLATAALLLLAKQVLLRRDC